MTKKNPFKGKATFGPVPTPTPESRMNNSTPFALIKEWVCEGRDLDRFPFTGKITAEDIKWAMGVLKSRDSHPSSV